MIKTKTMHPRILKLVIESKKIHYKDQLKSVLLKLQLQMLTPKQASLVGSKRQEIIFVLGSLNHVKYVTILKFNKFYFLYCRSKNGVNNLQMISAILLQISTDHYLKIWLLSRFLPSDHITINKDYSVFKPWSF